MNILNRFLGRPRKRPLNEKVDNIEEMVYELTDQVGKIHADMWDKLTAIEEQGNQRPSFVLAMPMQDGSSTDIAMFEPYEDFEPSEDGDDEEGQL